jgi:AcrR family transcriptional regulator
MQLPALPHQDPREDPETETSIPATEASGHVAGAAPALSLDVLPAAGTPQKSRMHGDDRRKQLLRVAIESFARNGFSGTKTKDIAAAAGVSEAILFRHFATKEDLYHAILDEKENQAAADADFAKLDELMRQRDDAGVFRMLGTHILHAFRDDPAFHRLIMYASLEGHLMASLFHERFAAPRGDSMKRYVALRQKEGAFRKLNPEVVLMSTLGVFVHYAMGRYVFGIKHPGRLTERPDESVIEEMVSIALNGLTEPQEIRRIIEQKENILEKKTRKDNHAKS